MIRGFYMHAGGAMARWMQPGNATEFRMVGILHVALFAENGTLLQTGEPTRWIIKGPVPFICSLPTPLIPTSRSHLTPSPMTIDFRTGHNIMADSSTQAATSPKVAVASPRSPASPKPIPSPKSASSPPAAEAEGGEEQHVEVDQVRCYMWPTF